MLKGLRRKAFTLYMLVSTVLIGLGTAQAESFFSSMIYLPLVFGSPPPTPTPTPQPAKIINPGFESGDQGWEIETANYSIASGTWIPTSENLVTNWRAYSGTYSIRLVNGKNYWRSSIAQRIYVPPGKPVLYYWQYIKSEEVICYQDTENRHDFLSFQIDGVEISYYPVCIDFAAEEWERWNLSLDGYQGQWIALKIEYQSDDSLSSELYLDDFVFGTY